MPNAKPTPTSTPAPAAGKAAGDSAAAVAASPAAPAVATGTATSQKAPIPAAAFDMPKPNQRGLNKPKCIQCGNVARSRCPFQCCKACCYKAQNPCHIHVLKQTNPLPDKPSPTTAPISEQPSTNSLLTGSVSRLTSLQRLPHHFLSALRANKSLDEKDIASINEWRFMKLKEHMQGEIDAENEAYERYTQNAGLLEETFFPTSENAAVEPEAETTFSERLDMLISEAIVRLKSDQERSDSYKERLGTILDQKLKELRESETAFEDQMSSVQKADDHTEVKFTTKQKMERNAKYNDLVAKMLMASCEDDLKPCREIAVELFGDKIDPPMDYKSDQMRLSPPSAQGSSAPPGPFPKLCIRREVDEDFAAKVNKEFESLSDIAQL